jgi:hypothetical protein
VTTSLIRGSFYGEYSNRVRGAAHCSGQDTTSVGAEPQPRRRCSPCWARLIANVYGFVSDQHSIRTILDHLDERVSYRVSGQAPTHLWAWDVSFPEEECGEQGHSASARGP